MSSGDPNSPRLPLFIVDAALRPARMAFALSSDPSSRVAYRAFRLCGGRWGGRYDVLLSLNPHEPIDALNACFLALADPDFVLVLDPKLEGYDWQAALQIADRQPFAVMRLRERMERTAPLRQLFVSQPTPSGSDEPGRRVLDVDRSGIPWRRIAINGLLMSDSTVERVIVRKGGVVTPVERSRYALRGVVAESQWILFGDNTDMSLAMAYWSLRALGARPLWLSADLLSSEMPPPQLGRVTHAVLYGPGVPNDDIQNAVTRWTSKRLRVVSAPENSSTMLPELPKPFLATQANPILPHRGLIRFATPTPQAPRGQEFRRDLGGVAEFRLRSPDADDPDGMILARTAASGRLIQRTPGDRWRRVTRNGFAEIADIATSQIVQLPLVDYRAAVGAPFEDRGFTVTPSDKGRYQQRTLVLARGLKYLGWLVRQPESDRLLRMFFRYHFDGGRPPADYRRAVRYDEFEHELHTVLRERRSQLRRPLIESAETWLEEWSSGLLERGLLIAGYVLNCSECSGRTWYAADTVAQTFVCQRCAHRAAIPGRVTRSFRLNEAFYQFLSHDGQVVTLTLLRLRTEANESFLYLPETCLDDGTRVREIDAAMLVDGRLAIVEAKSGDSLSNADVRWYSWLARRTRATRLVFSTTASNWNAATETRIADAQTDLNASGIDVISLRRTELLEEPAPGELDRFIYATVPSSL